MQSLLEAGYTTVLSGGSNSGADVALRDKIEKGSTTDPHHPVGPHPADADAGRSARRGAGDGGQGHQAHGRDRR